MTTIRLPSGLTGEFRGLTARDLRYLTNEKTVRDGEVEGFVLKNAWLGLSDAGPYSFTGRESVDWDQVLVGDRIVSLIEVRVATFPGQPYPAKLKCGDCGKSFEYEFDLEALLRENTKRLSPADAEIFKAGNRFDGVMPETGAAFKFKLRNGADAKRLAKYIEAKKNGSKQMQERANPLVDAIAASIVEIDGLERNTQDSRFDYLEKLSFGAFQDLVELVQKRDCGVETDVKVECSKCGAEQEISLPFAQRGFFNPKSAKKSLAVAPPSMDEAAAVEDAYEDPSM